MRLCELFYRKNIDRSVSFKQCFYYEMDMYGRKWSEKGQI